MNPGGTLALGVGGANGFSNNTAGAAGSISWLLINVDFPSGSALGIDTENAGGGFAYAGAITGSEGLTKMGAGTLTISSTDNTFTGPTTVSGGTLNLAGPLTNQAVNLAGGTTLSGTGILTLSSASGPATVTASGTGSQMSVPVLLASNGVVTVGTGGSVALSGPISGSGRSLALSGDGALILTGSNNYTGGTSVNGGVLALGSSTALPSGTGLYVAAGATVYLGEAAGGYASLEGSMGGGAGPMPTEAPSLNSKVVPEPGTLALLLVATACGLAVWRKKRGTKGCS